MFFLVLNVSQSNYFKIEEEKWNWTHFNAKATYYIFVVIALTGAWLKGKKKY